MPDPETVVKRRPVEIDGAQYPSVAAAAKAIGICTASALVYLEKPR